MSKLKCGCVLKDSRYVTRCAPHAAAAAEYQRKADEANAAYNERYETERGMRAPKVVDDGSDLI